MRISSGLNRDSTAAPQVMPAGGILKEPQHQSASGAGAKCAFSSKRNGTINPARARSFPVPTVSAFEHVLSENRRPNLCVIVRWLPRFSGISATQAERHQVCQNPEMSCWRSRIVTARQTTTKPDNLG